jgi:hypothetical protein
MRIWARCSRSSVCDTILRVSAELTRALSRDALFDALRARPPRTLLAHADRMLLASVTDPLDERASLLSRATSIVSHAHALSEGGVLFGELESILVLTALYLEHEAPAGEELRVFLAPFCMAARATVEARAEPARSVFLHWQERARLGKAFVPGDAPKDDMLALYHWAHVVFYETHYGARPLTPAHGAERSIRAAAALTHARAALTRIEEPNADCVAEVMLANECLRPHVDSELREALRASLGAMQQSDGTLDMPDDADPEARHHAMVVAALALALAGDD